MTDQLILQLSPLLVGEYWTLNVNRADPHLVDLYERHYSCYRYKDGRTRTQAVAPGQYLALMTTQRDALFIWQKSLYRKDGQQGINCAVFRNENPDRVKSSLLISEAVQIAWRRWPGERLFTFVDPGKIDSDIPGYCFMRAKPRWKRCGKTKSGLIILEVQP